ncbi:isoleucine--tRNA ligase, partial [Candidatus Bathyarchaeota archaeon]|nr:isoleucine--tRNA ligase [Candidatus Bathyarchaeota archaeon]
PQYLRNLSGGKSFVLPDKELAMLDWWRENGIYEKIKEKERNRPEFRFIDGPPYTTGSIHLGTAWNKILKDVIIRFKRMTGFRVTDTPGYDTHGLPIEVQMEKKLKTSNKKDIINKIGMDNFIDSCKEFALENLDVMNEQFRRLGCEFWNWERPYVTLKESYIQGCWWMIKRAAEKDLLYLGNRPLNTCPRCETALAKHEYEYKNRKDTSVYVKFKIIGRENEYFLIWTTTPWTLVANMAIMANPEIEYARIKAGDDILVMAKNLASLVVQGQLGEFPEILETFTGDKLAGLRYIHPLLDEVPVHEKYFKEHEEVHSILLTTEFVSASDGTGLVHCAPGFGPEDYHVAHVEHGIPAFSPVGEDGAYEPEAGEYAGMNVFDANPRIINLLEEKGTLAAKSELEHEYAHCWRCKSPLVYRVLDQWYLKTNTLSSRMIEENKKINWVPNFAGDKNFSNWLENLQDWCISRQRFWGIPMPIWTCDGEECDHFIVIGSRNELESLTGEQPPDLHRPWVDALTFSCEKCKKGTMHRVEDVVDVWLDSGCVMWASNEAVYGDDYCNGPKEYSKWKPADLILEGKDQIRGWFNSLMSCGILASDRPTYKNVVMHGFVTYEGEPMHKSRGNVVPPEEAINRRGAETYRLYCLQNMSMGEDLNFYWREFDESYRTINTIWNVFLYAKQAFDLHGFRSTGKMENLGAIEDRWMLSKLHSFMKLETSFLETYDLSKYVKNLRDFAVNDVSKWYLKLIKGRLAEDANETERCEAMETLYTTLRCLNMIMAPILPTVAELLHRDFMAGYLENPAESIHLDDWPVINESWIDDKLETLMDDVVKIVETTRMLREAANLKLKWPCKQLVVTGKDASKLKPAIPIFENEANVKKVILGAKEPSGKDFLKGDLESLTVFLDTTIDDEIMAERFFRDIFRQLQYLRKRANLNVGEGINLEIQVKSPIIKKYMEEFSEDIKMNAYVDSITFVDEPVMEGALVDEGLFFCPMETCLVPVKSKKIKRAREKDGKIACYYCKETKEIDELLHLNVRFSRS